VVVESSPSSVRILNVSPYNQFTVTCTARAEVEGETVPLEMTVDWVRRAQPSSGDATFSDVPSTEYETTGSPEDGYQSTLNTTETDTENTISYRCRAALDIDSSVQQNDDTVVTVFGKDVPYMHVYLPCVHPRVPSRAGAPEGTACLLGLSPVVTIHCLQALFRL